MGEDSEKSVAEGYARAAQLDPLRRGFYEESRSTSLVRLRTLAWLRDSGRDFSTQFVLGCTSLLHLAPGIVLPLFGLRYLDVSGGRLRELGPLLQLESLEELNASHNHLHGDVREAFCLPRLRRLNVSHNRLDLQVDCEGVTPPSSLVELDASGNEAVVGLLAETSAAALLTLLGGSAGWVVEADIAASRCVMRHEAS